MPYVAPDEGLDQPFVDLEDVARRMGVPEWRVALVGANSLRVVLLHWPPGYQTVPHHHPRAEEIFLVLRGRAGFAIGDGTERLVGPGELMYAKHGTLHAIRVDGDEPLTLLAAVAPNEDRPGETIESVSVAKGTPPSPPAR